MVKRNAQAYFASALVFPGGVVDPDDSSPDWLAHVSGAEGLDPRERARRIAAFRETFEEVGILLGASQSTAAVQPAPGASSFLDLVNRSSVKLPLEALHRFGHWITPTFSPKRYDTHFFLCGLSTDQAAVCDGGETTTVEWIAPAEALARAASGDRSILFPTRMNLIRLAESQDVASAVAAAKSSTPFTVLPVVEKTERGICVRIPTEAGYGVVEDWPTLG